MIDLAKIKKVIREDKDFGKSFSGVKSVRTAIAIARSKGLNVDDTYIEDIVNDKELRDDLITAAAGGKNDKYINQTTQSENTTILNYGHNSTINTDNHGNQGSGIY